MKKLLFILLLSLPTQSFGQSSKYFKTLPLSQSHTSFGVASRESLNPQSVKALIWNIKKAEINGWDKEFTTFAQEKDLVLIQEAYESEIFMKTLVTLPQVQCDFAISFLFMSYGATPTGNMICSDTIPLEFIVKHSPNREPVTNTPKAMAIGKYKLGDQQELLVISVHGINFNTNGAFERHMEQARVEIEDHDGPILFAGDFNTHTNGRLKYLSMLAKKLGLIEIIFKNGEFRSRAPVTRNFFDHAFVRGLHIKNAEVLKDSKASDHRPIVLELSL